MGEKMNGLRCAGCGALFIGSSTLKESDACTLCGSTLRAAVNKHSLHLCHAIDCVADVPPRMLMCRQHWFMVPKDIQTAVWCAYRPGQERDKHPSGRYLLVQAIAIAFVAFRELKWKRDRVAEHVSKRAELLTKTGKITTDDLAYAMRVIGRSELKAVAAC